MTEPSDVNVNANAPETKPSVPASGPKRTSASRKNRGGNRSGKSAPDKPRERNVPGGPRHLARITAMQILYEIDVADHAASDVLTRTFEDPDLSPEDDAPAGDALGKVRDRVERLVRGVLEHFHEIDPYIADAAPAFPITQLPAVDRNVLRLAVYELLREPGVPPRAAINEAVELAKRFGGDNSSRFVNGVLGTIVGRLDAERSAVPPPGEKPEADADSPGSGE